MASVVARPAQVDLDVYAGDDVALRVNVKNPDGTPADLTGMTASAQVRLRKADEIPLATFDAVIEADGVVVLSLPAAATVTLPSWAMWDCQLDLGGRITTIAAGSIRTTGEVTR